MSVMFLSMHWWLKKSFRFMESFLSKQCGYFSPAWLNVLGLWHHFRRKNIYYAAIKWATRLLSHCVYWENKNGHTTIQNGQTDCFKSKVFVKEKKVEINGSQGKAHARFRYGSGQGSGMSNHGHVTVYTGQWEVQSRSAVRCHFSVLTSHCFPSILFDLKLQFTLISSHYL